LIQTILEQRAALPCEAIVGTGIEAPLVPIAGTCP
jgi:hypothetical protein